MSLEGHRKAASYTDTADKLLACAEQITFFSTSMDREGEGGLVIKETGGSEEEKEKFTTETEMVRCSRYLFIVVEPKPVTSLEKNEQISLTLL